MLEQAIVPGTTEATGLFEPPRRACFLEDLSDVV